MSESANADSDSEFEPVNLRLRTKSRNAAESALYAVGYRRKLNRLISDLLDSWVDSGADTSILERTDRPRLVWGLPGSIAEPAYDYSVALQIPCYGSVSAGPGALISGTVEERLSCPPWITKPDDRLFALKVDGESMSPTLLPGDVVIVRGGQDATTGEMVIAQIEDEQGEPRGYVKYLRVEGTQRFLVSENEEGNPPRHLPQNASIVGKVIGAIRFLEGKDLVPAHLWESSGVLRLPDIGSAGSAASIFDEVHRIRERDEQR